MFDAAATTTPRSGKVRSETAPPIGVPRWPTRRRLAGKRDALDLPAERVIGRPSRFQLQRRLHHGDGSAPRTRRDWLAAVDVRPSEALGPHDLAVSSDSHREAGDILVHEQRPRQATSLVDGTRVALDLRAWCRRDGGGIGVHRRGREDPQRDAAASGCDPSPGKLYCKVIGGESNAGRASRARALSFAPRAPQSPGGVTAQESWRPPRRTSSARQPFAANPTATRRRVWGRAAGTARRRR